MYISFVFVKEFVIELGVGVGVRVVVGVFGF